MRGGEDEKSRGIKKKEEGQQMKGKRREKEEGKKERVRGGR